MQAKRIVVSVVAVGLGLGLLLTSVVGLTRAQEPGPPRSAARAQGSVPGTVSYQGRVTVEGEPFHDTGFFKFAIVDSWGDSTWSNDGTSVGGGEPDNAVPLDVSNGLFSVLLGDPVLGMVPLDWFAFVDPYSVLRVWFSPDGGDFVQLEDRPIAAVPYAFVADDADMVDGWHAYDFAAAGHQHWGETWSGSGTGLTLNSSGGGPTLQVGNGDSDGIYVTSPGEDGVEVHSAGQDGFYVSTAGDDGVQIGFQNLFGDYYGPADDGIVIYDAGNAPTHTLPIDAWGWDSPDGIDIAGAFGWGLWVGYASIDGVYVSSAGEDGLSVGSADDDGPDIYDAGNASTHTLPISAWGWDSHDGIDIGGAKDYGLWVGHAGNDGMLIYDAGNAPNHTLPVDIDPWFDTHDGIDIAGAKDYGLWVGYAGKDGVHIDVASNDGVFVAGADDDGVQIGLGYPYAGGAGDDGIVINDAGDAPTHTLPEDIFSADTHDGIDIAGAKDFGLWVGYAGWNGVRVNSAGYDGIRVGSAGVNGVYVESAGYHGVEVQSAVQNGLQVISAGVNGVYVESPDYDGVFVNSAGHDGVYANTTKASYQWGFNTPDKIQAMNVTMRSLSIIARNDGPVPLQAGDLVAVTGVDRPLLGGGTPMPNVRRADGRFSGVIGVVESRMKLTVVDPTEEWAERGEALPNIKPEDVIHEEARSVDGDAAPGEYVSIVVFGIADVKVDATAEAIEPGQRLTAADLAGHARALRSKLLDGMAVTEGAPVMGIALEPLEKGTGIIPVFVTLR